MHWCIMQFVWFSSSRVLLYQIAWYFVILFPVKPYRTPPSSNIQFSATQKCCGVVYFFFFCIFYFTIRFFQLKNSFSFFCLFLFRSNFFSYLQKYDTPKFEFVACWDWWLLKGHLLYGSTPLIEFANSTNFYFFI